MRGVLRSFRSGDDLAKRPPAIRSLQVWTVYLFLVGALLLLIPNVVLGLLGVAKTVEVWLRVAGMLVMLRGILYASLVTRRDEGGAAATVVDRWFAAVVLTVLAFTTGPWQLLLFAALDLVSAAWTYLTLPGRTAQAGSA